MNRIKIRQFAKNLPHRHGTNILPVEPRKAIPRRCAFSERKNYRRQITQTLLTIENVEEARDVIKAHFKPTVLKNGKVIYRAQDGGVVSDEATAISVPAVTEAATLLALSLADERFNGKPVVVEGSDEFKLQVAKLSAIEGLSIRFADPVLEKERQRHIRAKELNQEGADSSCDADNSTPAMLEAILQCSIIVP